MGGRKNYRGLVWEVGIITGMSCRELQVLYKVGRVTGMCNSCGGIEELQEVNQRCI